MNPMPQMGLNRFCISGPIFLLKILYTSIWTYIPIFGFIFHILIYLKASPLPPAPLVALGWLLTAGWLAPG